jgi:hypothetical protein
LLFKANSVKKQQIKFFEISLEAREQSADTVRGKEEQVRSQKKNTNFL